MKTNTLFVMAVLALSGTTSQAVAQEALTKESCIAYLTTGASGPHLNTASVRVGTLVFGEPMYDGMTLDYVCDREIRVQAALAQEQNNTARAQRNYLKEKQAGAANAQLRREVDANLIRSNPLETTVLIVAASMLTGKILVLLLKFVWRALMRFASFMWSGGRRKRRGFARSSTDHIHTSSRSLVP